MKNLYGLILAGGSGTRLWPISREFYPKQFLKLTGDKTLIQQTFHRLKKIIPAKNIYITTNRFFVDEIVDQLGKMGLHKENVIIQPTDKNTAPTIAQASKKIYEKNKDAIILNCPSDHIIEPLSSFSHTVRAGYKLAQKGKLITLGIKPTSPNPEYGYINADKTKSTNLNYSKGFKVKKFLEKPSKERARVLIKNGCLWNSGIFVWKAEVILNEIKKFSPEIYQALNSYKLFFALDPISIDKSVLEKSDLVWVIPASFEEWRDIGSWNALYEILPKDTTHNVLNNKVITYKVNDSLIYGTEGRFVAAINVNNFIIVDTKDYVFISPRENVQEIKDLLFKVQKNNPDSSLQKPLVSIIIPTQNDFPYIVPTMESIRNQNYKNTEIIIIDGGSHDKTKSALKAFSHKIEQYLDLPHSSHFERINKGIELSNGEIIGILAPGNSYIDGKVIEDVVSNMEKNQSDLSWGDLVYFSSPNENKISMYWKSSNYKKGGLQQGWILPHPTFFVRKTIYKKCGNYDIRFSIAAEYELILRLLEKHKVKGSYIPRILVKMTGRGINLKSILDRFRGNIESYKAWGENGLKINPLFLISKNISKINQFFGKKDLQKVYN